MGFKNKFYLAALFIGCFGLLISFQNCSDGFKTGKYSSLSNGTAPLDNGNGDTPTDVPTGPESTLPPVGDLIWSNEFNEANTVNEDFNIFAGADYYRDTIGQDVDLFFEEAYYSRPEAVITQVAADDASYLNLSAQPAIAVESGLTPAMCNNLILNLRHWGPNGGTLADNPEGSKLQVNDALQAPDGDRSYWNTLGNCRIYTALIRSKRTYGPGTRIQARINLSDMVRTGHIYMFRVTSPQAYDNNVNTGVDMSIGEFGWGRYTDSTEANQRSYVNTAVRWNYNVAPFDGYYNFFIDSFQIDQTAYRLTQDWNSNLQSGAYDTELVPTLPEVNDFMEGWYVFTLDWRADRLDFYYQKGDVDGVPIKYMTVTDPRMVSQACNQEIWLGNNVSQTFADTKLATVWDYVKPEAGAATPPINIVSPQYPAGRAYQTYKSDAMKVDWVRTYNIPGGEGATNCNAP